MVKKTFAKVELEMEQNLNTKKERLSGSGSNISGFLWDNYGTLKAMMDEYERDEQRREGES